MYWLTLDLCCQCAAALVARTALPCPWYVSALFSPSMDWSTVSRRPFTRGLANATHFCTLAFATLRTCCAAGMSPTCARRLACPRESATSQRTLWSSISPAEGELVGVAQVLSLTIRQEACCCVCLQLRASK